MDNSKIIPHDYKRIKVVGSITELFNEKFGGAEDVNCVLYPRSLKGDFNALARRVSQNEPWLINIDGPGVYFDRFFSGNDLITEREQIISDYEQIKQVANYSLRVENLDNPSTDVKAMDRALAFHADRVASVERGITLCCYNTPVTEWIKAEEAIPMEGNLTTPDINYYAPEKGAEIFSFQPGDIFRMASQYSPDRIRSGAKPLDKNKLFIHRAPASIWNPEQGRSPRMLLAAF